MAQGTLVVEGTVDVAQFLAHRLVRRRPVKVSRVRKTEPRWGSRSIRRSLCVPLEAQRRLSAPSSRSFGLRRSGLQQATSLCRLSQCGRLPRGRNGENEIGERGDQQCVFNGGNLDWNRHGDHSSGLPP